MRGNLHVKIPVAIAAVALCLGLILSCTSTASAWTGTAVSTPKTAYIGDIVDYKFRLTNTGDKTLEVNTGKISIDWGATTTTRALSVPDIIAPGQSADLTCTYTVPSVAFDTYPIAIEVWGQAVGDWFEERGQWSSTITIEPIPDLGVSVQASKTSGTTPMTTTFTATPDMGVGPYTYSWTFGDSGTGSLKSVSHTYTTAGTYTATCLVTDAKGQTASDSITITVTAPPATPDNPTVNPPVNPPVTTKTSSGLEAYYPILLLGIIGGIVAIVALLIVKRK